MRSANAVWPPRESVPEVVAGDCHLANTAITEQTGRVPIHPIQVVARAYGIPTEE